MIYKLTLHTHISHSGIFYKLGDLKTKTVFKNVDNINLRCSYITAWLELLLAKPGNIRMKYKKETFIIECSVQGWIHSESLLP